MFRNVTSVCITEGNGIDQSNYVSVILHTGSIHKSSVCAIREWCVFPNKTAVSESGITLSGKAREFHMRKIGYGDEQVS
jgi:hypothetical protein